MKTSYRSIFLINGKIPFIITCLTFSKVMPSLPKAQLLAFFTLGSLQFIKRCFGVSSSKPQNLQFSLLNLPIVFRYFLRGQNPDTIPVIILISFLDFLVRCRNLESWKPSIMILLCCICFWPFHCSWDFFATSNITQKIANPKKYWNCASSHQIFSKSFLS